MSRFIKAAIAKLAVVRTRWVGVDYDCIDGWFEVQPEDEVDGLPPEDDVSIAPLSQPLPTR
ncbi:MAG: hypothetical protein U0V87_09840 [Acidobacteriota bacterium]